MGNLSVKDAGVWKNPIKLWVKTPSSPRLDLDFTASDVLDPRVEFSRASLGTYYGSDGLLKYAAHNLCWPSEDFNAWTKGNGATVTVDATTAPNGTTTADQINHVTAGTVTGGEVRGLSGVASTFTTVICSVYAKAGTKTFLAMGNNANGIRYCYFNLATGAVGTRDAAGWASSGIEDAGSGWYRCWGRVTVTTMNTFYLRVGEADNTATCTSPGNIYLWGSQVEYVTTETTPRPYMSALAAAVHGPRFDYDPVTHAARGLLIEEARTNGFTYTQDFTQTAWTKTGATVTGDQIVAPDGTTTADLITASASPGHVNTGTTFGAGTAYSMSVYAKKGTSDWIYLCGEITTTGPETPKAYFNLNTGVVGTVETNITSATIESVGNGWYRCWFTRLGTSGGEKLRIGPCDANGSETVTVGKTAYVWGAQSETGAFVSSYIPTGPSGNVTRAADVAVMTGSNFSSWYDQSAGTFVAEFDVLAASGVFRTIANADNNTNAEYVSLWVNGAVQTNSVKHLNSVQTDLALGSIAANTIHKTGISFALNDFAGCRNGGTVVTDTVGTLAVPTQLRIGGDGAAADYLNGHIRRIRYWNTRKSDAELQTLTAGGAISGSDWVEPLGGYIKQAGAWTQFYPNVYTGQALDLDFTATTTLDPRITFSRASLGTYFDSAGVLKYAGHNLAWPSEDFSSSQWTKVSGATVTADAATAPNGTTTADRLNHTTAGTVNSGDITKTITPPQPSITSIYAKAGTKSWLAISSANNFASSWHCYFNLAAGTVGAVGSDWAASGIESVGNGWYRCWAIGKPTTQTSPTFYLAEGNASVVMTSPGDIYIWGAQTESITVQTTPSTYLPTTTVAVHGPRFDYDPVTHAAKGLLIEESRANGLWATQDFTNTGVWTKTGVTVTADQIVALDGTTTVDLITASASPATIAQTSVHTGNYTASVYVKKGTSDWIYMVGQSVDVPKAWFNLATGTTGTLQAGLVSSSIRDVGNGWWRCWLVDVAATGSEFCTIGLCDADNSATVTVGKTVYLWGAQCENGDFPSSYIPTVGPGLTRAADIAVMTGSNFSSWFGSATAGTFVAEFEIYAGATAGFRVAFSVENVAVTQQINFYRNGSGIARTDVAGNGSFVSNVGTVAAGINKLGLSLATNDAAASLNGAAPVLKTSAVGMPAPTQARIGADNNAGNILNGYIRRIRFFNTAKSDAELQALTT